MGPNRHCPFQTVLSRLRQRVVNERKSTCHLLNLPHMRGGHGRHRAGSMRMASCRFSKHLTEQDRKGVSQDSANSVSLPVALSSGRHHLAAPCSWLLQRCCSPPRWPKYTAGSRAVKVDLANLHRAGTRLSCHAPCMHHISSLRTRSAESRLHDPLAPDLIGELGDGQAALVHAAAMTAMTQQLALKVHMSHAHFCCWLCCAGRGLKQPTPPSPVFDVALCACL